MKSLLAASACVFALLLLMGPRPAHASVSISTNGSVKALDSDKGGVTLKDDEIKDGKDKDKRSKTKPPKDSDDDHDNGKGNDDKDHGPHTDHDNGNHNGQH